MIIIEKSHRFIIIFESLLLHDYHCSHGSLDRLYLLIGFIQLYTS
jgi:hypothetical protein